MATRIVVFTSPIVVHVPNGAGVRHRGRVPRAVTAIGTAASQARSLPFSMGRKVSDDAVVVAGQDPVDGLIENDRAIEDAQGRSVGVAAH